MTAIPSGTPDQQSTISPSTVVSVWLAGARFVIDEPAAADVTRRTDVTADLAQLVALGLHLGADGPAAAPSAHGATTSDGRVTAAAASLRNADGCTIAVRWGDGEVEVLDHHAAVVAASRAISEIIDPPAPSGPAVTLPFGA